MRRLLLQDCVLVVLFNWIVLVQTRSACGRGRFLDPDSQMCEYCSVVCDNMEIQNTVSKCSTNCPDFLKKTTSPTASTWASSLSTPTGLKVVATTSTTYSPLSLKVVAPVASIAAVVVILALSLYHRQKLHQMYLSAQCYRHNKRPVQEVGRDHDGHDDAPGPNAILMGNITTMDRNYDDDVQRNDGDTRHTSESQL
ncbi:uncharacterized protein [Haliotis cracherodii]|uniref:uncharacterized protein n=1 Tax=Haliotis cracherodii TaxID=6455 RepID=UPI0039E74F5F